MEVGNLVRNGWSAVPVDAAIIFKGKPFIYEPQPLLATDVAFPAQDPYVIKTQAFSQKRLTRPTYNHSMRVYYFASIIIEQQFPQHGKGLSSSTLALACLLHDLGTVKEFLSTTRMSFEFYGALKALEFLESIGSPVDQAEAVAEAIIRHQDLGLDGNITFLGQVIQLATIFDNVGEYPTIEGFSGIIHPDSVVDVNRAFPREGWLGCFAEVIREEERLKPWCHSTHIENFADKVMANKLMQPFE